MQFIGDTKLQILNTIRVKRQHKGYPILKFSENNYREDIKEWKQTMGGKTLNDENPRCNIEDRKE